MIKKLVYIVGITLFACTLPAAAQDIKETKDTEDTQATGRYSDLIKEYQQDMRWQEIWGEEHGEATSASFIMLDVPITCIRNR